ncbi:MAG: NAD(+)/NADH kinase [Myxococcales bacterium]|nr:NAD(+)/NADH kinase [Myxococcales bacterium]
MKIQSIGICLKPDQPDCKEVVARLVTWAAGRQVELVLDREVDRGLEIPIFDRVELCAKVDLIVSVGGDGTLLSVARALGTRDVPILGINLGRLGFLTEVNRDEMEECLDRMLKSDFPIEPRMRLDIRVYRDEQEIACYLALNDLVITRTALSRMIDLETFADGSKVTTYHADGLILSTPTGSTAYSLSAAGPILLPGLEAIVLTPICPHSLNQRPLVLPQHTEVEVRVRHISGSDSATLTIDGQDGLELSDRDRVITRRSPHSVHIVSSPFRNRFEILHTKLNWGDR